ELGMNDLPELLCAEFGCRVAGYGLACSIYVSEFIAAADEDRRGGGFGHGAEARLALAKCPFGCAAGREVSRNALNSDRCSVAEDESSADLHGNASAVLAHELEFIGVDLLALEFAANVVHRAFEVFGSDHLGDVHPD